MPVTEDHIENIVASLVAQGLLHGFIAHSQGRFAIIGAKQKGAVAAGWPPPAEILATGLKEGEDVPGWVKRV
ncbi:PCI domain-containing protein [Apiospora hydei]|uniref:PCI domain-containing protein n=1 Tax=Apiospora hydei TaxID=1337664 RepID=A0ABR1WE77_9PEZI